MAYRFTVEIFGAGRGEEALHIGATKRARALATAERWHSKGFAVMVHDHMTGEVIYNEM